MTEYICIYDDDEMQYIPNPDLKDNELIRCKDCKHRPTLKYCNKIEGFNLRFPDNRCPCQCEDDPFYSWMPSDDWHCGNGEMKEE